MAAPRRPSGPSSSTARGSNCWVTPAMSPTSCPTTLQAGELSLMIPPATRGRPGTRARSSACRKARRGDITDNDYRVTAEIRGRDYSAPGAVTFRIISGRRRQGASATAPRRRQLQRRALVLLAVHLGRRPRPARGPRGRPERPADLFDSRGTAATRIARRPTSSILATDWPRRPARRDQPGIIIKNVWASSRPRPAFPGE